MASSAAMRYANHLAALDESNIPQGCTFPHAQTVRLPELSHRPPRAGEVNCSAGSPTTCTTPRTLRNLRPRRSPFV